MAARGRPASPALNDKATALFRQLMNEGMRQFDLTRSDLVRANDQTRRERRQMNARLRQENPELRVDLAPVPNRRTERWVYKCFESGRPLLVKNAFELYGMLRGCKHPKTLVSFDETPMYKDWITRMLSLPSHETPWFLSETTVLPMALINSRQYEVLAKALAAVVLRELNIKSERIAKMRLEEITEAIRRYFKRHAPGWALLQWRYEKVFFEEVKSGRLGPAGTSRLERKRHTIGGPFGDAWTRFRFGEPNE